jgi:hypothetical protein
MDWQRKLDVIVFSEIVGDTILLMATDKNNSLETIGIPQENE